MEDEKQIPFLSLEETTVNDTSNIELCAISTRCCAIFRVILVRMMALL